MIRLLEAPAVFVDVYTEYLPKNGCTKSDRWRTTVEIGGTASIIYAEWTEDLSDQANTIEANLDHLLDLMDG